MDTEFLPIVDLSGFGVGHDKKDDVRRSKIVKEIYHAFSSIGFVYLINHGIPIEQVNGIHETASKFFSLQEAKKEQYKENNGHGWLERGIQRLNPNRPEDYIESYDITLKNAKKWPNDEVSGFQETMETFIKSCQELALTVLNMMALGLELEDEHFFEKYHNFGSNNSSKLRCISYPPIPKDIEMKAGQARCGEHTDFCSITLLFQDSTGGLEVMNKHGVYQAATPVEGAVLINIGDLMQRWTTDKLVSTAHRVVITEDEAIKRATRRSIPFFVQPDDDCLVECINGSDKYPPITAIDFYESNIKRTRAK